MQDTAAPRRKAGRPTNAERAIRAAEAPQVSIGHNSGKAVALGRDGSELTRKRTITSDIFHIPFEMIPQGWAYQWNVLEVTGQPQTAQRLAMAENGWRPVPAERHPGYFMPEGYKGPIIRDGLQLEERPAILNEEAKREELAKARKQVMDQQEQLRLTATRHGASVDPQYRGTGAVARQTYAPAPDAPRPQLPIDPAA